jgi:large repetitive protein
MRQFTLSTAVVTILLLAVSFAPAFAHSIDYLASAISPAADFNGNSANFTLQNPVSGGASIQFDLKFSINAQGGTTTYPRTITFGATTQSKPVGASNPLVSGLSSCTFTGAASTCTNAITIAAPSTAGPYSVKIQPTSGTGGREGLSSGGGVTVNFTVDNSSPILTSLALTLGDNGCILYHQAAVVFTATLTETVSGDPVEGKQIKFSVDGDPAGFAVTNANGVATMSYTSSALTVGDHSVVATFDGDSSYVPSNHSQTLGVTYLFIGYQQPINADGSSVFGGKVIPVKVKLADANGAAVPDAEAHVFFAFGTPAVVGTEAESIGSTSPDGGNQMRYDASADQYIFNWDVSGKGNGTHTVRVDLGEESCGAPHTALVSLKRKGK